MVIIYTCPKCGSDLIDLVITTNPPKSGKQCPNCGWHHIEESEEQEIRIPYPGYFKEVPNVATSTFTDIDFAFQNDACSKCSQNPKNGGSGICHCTLGIKTIY